jgi:hypothetical protein
MRIVHFETRGVLGIAADEGSGWHGLTQRDSGFSGTLPELIAQGADLLRIRRSLGQSPAIDLNAVRLLPPVPVPPKILCVGLNYDDHLQESGLKKPTYPEIFARFASSLIAHQKPMHVEMDLTETITEEEPGPCHILITNVSGSGSMLESHSSVSTTLQSIFLMTFCPRNSTNSADNWRTMPAACVVNRDFDLAISVQLRLHRNHAGRVRDCFDSIQHQVHEHLLNLHSIRHGHWKIVFKIGADRHSMSSGFTS